MFGKIFITQLRNCVC